MHHVTHMNESWHTYELVTSHMNEPCHVCMSHVTHLNKSCRTYNASCLTYGWIISQIWMIHVAHLNESCHTYEWKLPHIWNESLYTFERGMSHIWITRLNVLAKNRRNWHDKSISSIQALKSQKRDFRDFSGTKVCCSNRNVKFKNSMHMEWSEEKFLKGIVGDRTRLRFWNKHQKIKPVFTQLVRYNWLHRRVLKYQKTIPEKLANK